MATGPLLPSLRIRVRLFAMQRETAGMRELRLEVPVGATVDDAWDAVVGTVPALAPGRASLRFAVNGTYADPDTTLADGDEVACIPPVSGGSDDGRLRILEIHEAAFPADLVQTLTRAARDGRGRGRRRVHRPHPRDAGDAGPGTGGGGPRHEGRRVDGLEYEAFEPMAVRVLEAIADEIEARFGVRRLAIVHRSGAVPLGEASVIVVAVAPHRDAAFAAARYAIDETKARAPIWKAERFTDGHVWVGHVARTAPEPPEA